MSRLIGFAWEKAETKQVVYMSSDGHIHELHVKKQGSWKHADLTLLTGAPSGDTVYLRAGYEWTTGGTKQVVFTHNPDFPGGPFNIHIHELYVSEGGPWKHADLTQLSGAPPPYEGKLTAYAWEAGGAKQIGYRIAAGEGPYENGHIYELYVTVGGSWKYADLTALGANWAASPPPSGFAISGYEWPEVGTKQMVWFTPNIPLVEAFVGKDGTWDRNNLTSHSEAPDPLPIQIHGFAWKAGGTRQVIYFTPDRHIHEIYISKGEPMGETAQWKHADLTALTNSPVVFDVNFGISAYSSDAFGTKQVVYIGVGGHIHELSVAKGGSWQHADLTELTGAPTPTGSAGACVSGYAWETGGSKQVVYPDSDGHIHELYIRKGERSWKHADLTEVTNSPTMW